MTFFRIINFELYLTQLYADSIQFIDTIFYLLK